MCACSKELPRPTHADNPRTMVRCVRTTRWRTVADQVCSWYSRQACRALYKLTGCATAISKHKETSHRRLAPAAATTNFHFVLRRPSDHQGVQEPDGLHSPPALGTGTECAVAPARIGLNFPHVHTCQEGNGSTPVGSGITRSDGGGVQSHVRPHTAPEHVEGLRTAALKFTTLGVTETADMFDNNATTWRQR